MTSHLSGRPRLSPGLLQLCCTSPLRLSSQPLTPVLSLESDPQILSLTQHLVPSCWVRHAEKHLRLGSAGLCAEFSPFCLLCTCCCTPFWGSEAPHIPALEEVSKCAATFLPSQLPPQGSDPILIPLSVFFFFFLFLLPYSAMWRLACLFEVWGFQPAFSRYSIGVVPHADVFLMYLWEERWSPYLTPSPS